MSGLEEAKKKKKYGTLIKVTSVSVIAMSCFVLGVFVGKFFGDTKETYNNQDDTSEVSEDKRSLASVESGRKLIVVSKKPKASFKGTARGIASVDAYSDDQEDSSSDKYTIAITQYEKRDMAIIHVEELRSQGFIESFYVKVSSEPPSYQVNIGLYDTREDAVDKKNSLSQILDLSDATIKLQSDSIIKVSYD